MKKISLVLSLFLLSIGLIGCQQNSEGMADNPSSNTKSLDEMTIYSMGSNSEPLVIKDTETMEMLKEVVDSAEKQAGIVNMADPEYKIELGEGTYLLWIDENSGTIMNTEDTHTIYSLSENSIKQVNGFLN